MAFRSALARGGWFNSSALKNWDQAAKTYGQMATKVEAAATAATKVHVIDPAATAMRTNPAAKTDVAAFMGVFADDGNLYAGLPAGHDALRSATDTEYGTETAPPAPHFRWAIQGGRDAANQAFTDTLAEGASIGKATPSWRAKRGWHR